MSMNRNKDACSMEHLLKPLLKDLKEAQSDLNEVKELIETQGFTKALKKDLKDLKKDLKILK